MISHQLWPPALFVCEGFPVIMVSTSLSIAIGRRGIQSNTSNKSWETQFTLILPLILLPLIVLVYLWFGFLCFFKEKLLILFFVWLKPVFLLFLLTCLFALSFFLSHSFSAFKYHHLFNSLFRFSFGSIAHYLSTFPLIFVCSSLFFILSPF